MKQKKIEKIKIKFVPVFSGDLTLLDEIGDTVAKIILAGLREDDDQRKELPSPAQKPFYPIEQQTHKVLKNKE